MVKIQDGGHQPTTILNSKNAKRVWRPHSPDYLTRCYKLQIKTKKCLHWCCKVSARYMGGCHRTKVDVYTVTEPMMTPVRTLTHNEQIGKQKTKQFPVNMPALGWFWADAGTTCLQWLCQCLTALQMQEVKKSQSWQRAHAECFYKNSILIDGTAVF